MTTFTPCLWRTISLLPSRPAASLNRQSLLLTSRHVSTPSHQETASSPSPSKINGPPSTLPAPLTLPTRANDQSLPSHLFATGKTYLTFYKTGIKNLYKNYTLSRPLQKLIDRKYNSSLPAAVAANAITRSDLQLLVRNWHDVKRVPVFGLVFICCGEFTPLVVILISNVVPWTCRIPRQIRSDREKLEERRRISFRNLTSGLGAGKRVGVEEMGRMELLHISWSLGLSSSVWDWLGGQLPGLWTRTLRKRVRRRVEYLGMDDGLIARAGGVGGMAEEEVRMACVERGIDIVGRKEAEVRGDLEAWVKSAARVGVEPLLLTRPSVWPVERQGTESTPSKMESKRATEHTKAESRSPNKKSKPTHGRKPKHVNKAL